ncbi:MAG: zinc metalloprotease HtpX [Nanobdellota archaeon]
MILNKFKTAMLLALLTALLLWAGQALGGAGGLGIAIILVLAMNLGSFWFSDKIVLSMYKAKKVSQKEAPRLYSLVKDISERAELPMPKIYILPSMSPNAFATGRSPSHSAVAATKGLMEMLNDEELKGVLAHEMSHVRHRDTLIQTISGMIAGIISYLAIFARFGALFGLGGDDENGGILGILLMSILAPLAASIIQMAISRNREFMADEGAAKLLNNPNGLAKALRKIEEGVKKKPMKMGGDSTAHLFISNPFKAKKMMNLFSTHPTTDARVKRLESLNV